MVLCSTGIILLTEGNQSIIPTLILLGFSEYPELWVPLFLVFLSIYTATVVGNLQVTSVVSDSVQPRRRQPTRLPRPWDSPGKNTGVGCHFLLQCMKVKRESEVAQSCPTLSIPMDCSLPGSSVHGIFQAGVLEWVAIAFSSGGEFRYDHNHQGQFKTPHDHVLFP